MFAMIQAAGWPVWFLLAASLVGLTLIVERLLYLRTERILPSKLLDEAIAVARAGRVDDGVIRELAQDSPLGQVLAAGMRHLATAPNSGVTIDGHARVTASPNVHHSIHEGMRETLEEAGRVVAHRLQRYLTTLGTVATLAPLLGLFGTVVGMIELFGAQDAGGADPLQVAHGISVALYNTAFGLAIAMPALLFHRHFHALVDGYVIELQQQAQRFMAATLGAVDGTTPRAGSDGLIGST